MKDICKDKAKKDKVLELIIRKRQITLIQCIYSKLLEFSTIISVIDNKILLLKNSFITMNELAACGFNSLSHFKDEFFQQKSDVKEFDVNSIRTNITRT